MTGRRSYLRRCPGCGDQRLLVACGDARVCLDCCHKRRRAGATGAQLRLLDEEAQPE